MCKYEEIALRQYVALCRLDGIRSLHTDKIQYLKQWKVENKVWRGYKRHSEVCQWDVFSLKQARHTVPLLQSVFQANAAHINFGKYTLYSCYGNTANCSTFPIAIAIIFENEDNGWTMFWKFVKNIHPTIQEPRNTIITD